MEYDLDEEIDQYNDALLILRDHEKRLTAAQKEFNGVVKRATKTLNLIPDYAILDMVARGIAPSDHRACVIGSAIQAELLHAAGEELAIDPTEPAFADDSPSTRIPAPSSAQFQDAIDRVFGQDRDEVDACAKAWGGSASEWDFVYGGVARGSDVLPAIETAFVQRLDRAVSRASTRRSSRSAAARH